jgi:hypothetical protein
MDIERIRRHTTPDGIGDIVFHVHTRPGETPADGVTCEFDSNDLRLGDGRAPAICIEKAARKILIQREFLDDVRTGLMAPEVELIRMPRKSVPFGEFNIEADPCVPPGHIKFSDPTREPGSPYTLASIFTPRGVLNDHAIANAGFRDIGHICNTAPTEGVRCYHDHLIRFIGRNKTYVYKILEWLPLRDSWLAVWPD